MALFGRLRTGRAATALLIGGALMAGAAPPAAMAQGTVYTIGVDNAGPPGHDFEYVDFFPRDGVKVSPNDVLDFHWNVSTLDGAHTVTFAPTGTGQFPLAIPETTSDEPALQLNPDTLFPSDPTCGESQSNPCVFDGTNVVSSGFIANGSPTPPYGADFFVKLDAKLLTGGSPDIKYVCELHPGMAGTVTLVAGGDTSTLDQVQSRAAAQLDNDTRGAVLAEKSDSTPFVQRRPDGTANVTAIAGTATPYVEVVEMLPSTLTIKPGDTVTWVTKSIKDPHTVTFPRGDASIGIDPLPAACEGPQGDTPPSSAGPPCADPRNFELHLVPQPQGSFTITSPATLGTSGLIGPIPGAPLSFTFAFPTAGSFDYMCRIHDHMVGLVVVKS